MKTLFNAGFRNDLWRPALGQAGAAGIIPEIITEAGKGFTAYEQQQIEEEKRKAEAAKAQAAAAQAAAAQAQAKTAAIQAGSGVSTTTLVLGGVGLLAAVGLIIAATR